MTGAYGLTGAEMAVHSAAGLAVVGLGPSPRRGLGFRKRRAKRPHWLPLPIALGVAMISVSLWQQAESDSQALRSGGTRAARGTAQRRPRPRRLGRDRAPRLQLAGPGIGHRAYTCRFGSHRSSSLKRSRSVYGIALVGREFRDPSGSKSRESARTSQVIAGARRAEPEVSCGKARAAQAQGRRACGLRQADSGFLVGVSVQSDRRFSTGPSSALFRYEDFFETALAAHRNTDLRPPRLCRRPRGLSRR